MACVGACISDLGWTWTNDAAILRIVVDGQRYKVAVPITRVQAEVSTELAAVGCYMPRAVGAGSTVGFFGSLKKAFRKAKRAVQSAVPRAIRRASNRVYRTATRAIRTTRRFGRSVIRSNALKAGLFAASFVPGLAVVTAPTLAAIQVADMIDRRVAAGEQAARLLASGVRSGPAQAARNAGLVSLRSVHQLRRMAPGNPAAARVLAALQKKYGRA